MTKITNYLLIALILLSVACTGGNGGAQNSSSKVIETNVPVRPAGQEDMVAFAAPKIEVVRVGFIGLGMRGPGAVNRFTHIPGVEIKALADLHMDRAEKAQGILTRAELPEAALYGGSEDAWKRLASATI